MKIKIKVANGEYHIAEEDPRFFQVGLMLNMDFQGGIDMQEIIKILPLKQYFLQIECNTYEDAQSIKTHIEPLLYPKEVSIIEKNWREDM